MACNGYERTFSKALAVYYLATANAADLCKSRMGKLHEGTCSRRVALSLELDNFLFINGLDRTSRVRGAIFHRM